MPQLQPQLEAYARLLAQGTRQIEAYAKTHPGRGGTRKTHVEQASKKAALPNVRARVEELRNLHYPVNDYRALREEMISNMRWLAKESPDQRVRLAASKMCHDIAVERIQAEGRPAVVSAAASADLDRLVAEVMQAGRRELKPALELEAVRVEEEPPSTDQA
jgi:hypothetical protein